MPRFTSMLIMTVCTLFAQYVVSNHVIMFDHDLWQSVILYILVNILCFQMTTYMSGLIKSK